VTTVQKRFVAFSHGEKGLKEILDRNKKWSKQMTKEDPSFFSKLSDVQTPEILWIGIKIGVVLIVCKSL
jgi:hypothetical protein